MAVTTDVPRCPGCGASYALVGRVHRCPAVSFEGGAAVTHIPDAPDSVTHAVTHNAERQRQFRERHGEEYRRKNRERMRRMRHGLVL